MRIGITGAGHTGARVPDTSSMTGHEVAVRTHEGQPHCRRPEGLCASMTADATPISEEA
jgi:hypothetical protein